MTENRLKLPGISLFLVGFAFVKKDFLEDTSYRLAFAIDLVGTFLEIALFYFIAVLIGKSADNSFVMEGYGYFSFLLVGIAFMRYTNGIMRSYAHKIQDYQMAGTLEAMLTTPVGTSRILFCSVLWQHLYLTFIVILYFVIGIAFFGLKLSYANWPSVVCIFLLTAASFSALGILAASFIMFYKRGDPVLWLFGVISSILGSVYFPVRILPQWLQNASDYIPITYTLKAMRMALFEGATLVDVSAQATVLLLFVLVLMPLSLISFNYSVRRAKRAGTLSHF